MKKTVALGVLFTLAGAAQALGSVSCVLHDESPSWGHLMDSVGNVWEDPRVGDAHDPWISPPGTFNEHMDVYGTPVFEFDVGTVVFGTGALQSVTIDYESPSYRSLWHILKPGDLFLDVGNDGKFDYVARTPFYAQADYYNESNPPASTLYQANQWDLYKLDPSEDYLHDRAPGNGVYQLAYEAGKANSATSGWSGVTVRDYHPWAFTQAYIDDLENDALVGQVSFGGWDDLSASGSVGSSTWTFSGYSLTIPLGTEVGIGFTVNCANEVLLGDVLYIPEPAAIVVWSLFGLVAAGYGVWRRKRSV